jgi:thiamine biosynthesis lipoprotein ApbE
MPASSAAVGRRTSPALGTYATLLTANLAALEPAQAFLDAELRAVDAACSRFRTDSELWRVNHADGRPVRIGPLLAEALSVALTAALVTDGDVDLTCGGSLVRLGYDRDFPRVRENTSTLRQPATPAPGWRSVELDPALRQVRVPAGVVLDLGATAKALAADRAAVGIAAALGCGVLVNLGGDIRVAGDPPAGGWKVGIADDVDFDGAGAMDPDSQAVMIRDGGLATSATAVRSWQRGAARFHHIIMPATGLPAQSCWRAVTVAAATCVDANTASTAAIVRGERAAAWLAGLGLPSRLVRHEGEVVIVAGWPPATASGGPPPSAGPGPATPRSAGPGPATPPTASSDPATPRSANPDPATPPHEGAYV